MSPGSILTTGVLMMVWREAMTRRDIVACVLIGVGRVDARGGVVAERRLVLVRGRGRHRSFQGMRA